MGREHTPGKLCSLPTVQTPLKYAAINGLFPLPLLATHLVVMFLPLFPPFPVVTTRGGRKRRKLRHEQTDDGPNSGDSSSSDSPAAAAAATAVVTRFRERIALQTEIRQVFGLTCDNFRVSFDAKKKLLLSLLQIITDVCMFVECLTTLLSLFLSPPLVKLRQ